MRSTKSQKGREAKVEPLFNTSHNREVRETSRSPASVKVLLCTWLAVNFWYLLLQETVALASSNKKPEAEVHFKHFKPSL